MTNYTVAQGTDWVASFTFGSTNDRWRLSDFDLFMHVKRPNDDATLLDLTTANGKLIIKDDMARLLEANAGWQEVEDIEPGPFEFDILFENRVTGLRFRSEIHTLSVSRGVTSVPEV